MSGAALPSAVVMLGMNWDAFEDPVYRKSDAYECRQTWLAPDARFTIVHVNSRWTAWRAVWWHGNIGESLGEGSTALDAAKFCKNHLMRFVKGLQNMNLLQTNEEIWTQSSSKLLRCPWCGGVPSFRKLLEHEFDVACRNDGCVAKPSVNNQSLLDAMRDWNTRGVPF